MRFDIFTKKSGEWICYVQAVTKANTLRMISALEAGGAQVLACYHAKVMGRMVYQTGEGWNFKRTQQK